MKIFIDENFAPQLADGLNLLEQPCNDCVTVHSIRKEFREGITDEEWIIEVSKDNGIVITQDIAIHRNKNQRKLYRENKIGLILFKPPKNKGFRYWDMVENIVKHWKEIKRISNSEDMPFAYMAKNSGGLSKMY